MIPRLGIGRKTAGAAFFAAAAVSFILASPGGDATVLEIRGPSLADGSRVFNCLTYQACDVITPSWETDGVTATIRLEIPRGRDEIETQLSRCDLSDFRGKLAFVGPRGRQAVRLRAGEAKLDLRPALYGKQDPASVAAGLASVDRLIREGDFQGSIRALLGEFGIDRQGYEFELETSAVRRAWTAMGGTRMAIPVPRDACDLIGFVRHEYEHVRQKPYQDDCRARGLPDSLEGETRYEFAAHYADIAAMETFCPRQAQAMGAVSRAYLMPFVKEP